MPCRGHEVLHRIIDLEVLLQGSTADGLDVVLLQSAFEELAGDTKLVVQHVWDLEDGFGAEVLHLPDGQVLEELFWCVLLAGFDFELVGDELELSLGDGAEETEGVEFEVARCRRLGVSISSEMVRKIEYIPTQMDSRFATVPPQVIWPQASGFSGFSVSMLYPNSSHNCWPTRSSTSVVIGLASRATLFGLYNMVMKYPRSDDMVKSVHM